MHVWKTLMQLHKVAKSDPFFYYLNNLPGILSSNFTGQRIARQELGFTDKLQRNVILFFSLFPRHHSPKEQISRAPVLTLAMLPNLSFKYRTRSAQRLRLLCSLFGGMFSAFYKMARKNADLSRNCFKVCPHTFRSCTF